MFSLEVKGAEKVERNLKAMRKRAQDLRPLQNQLRQAIAETHRKAFALRPVGDMKGDGLGAAIIRGELFSVSADSLTYGSHKPYGVFYAAWRVRRGLGPLMQTQATAREVADLLARYIVKGR